MNDTFGQDDGLLDEMLGDFLDESDEIVSSLNDNLLRLDEWVQSLSETDSTHCDDDLMNEMFRGAHSLKGLSGMLGLTNINALTHKVENIFDAARNDQLTLTSSVVELIFQSIDRLTGMIECLKRPYSDPVECHEVLDRIDEVLQDANVKREQASACETDQVFSTMQAATTESNEATSEPVGQVGGSANGASLDLLDHFADIVDAAEFSPKYLAIFVDESADALDAIDEALMGTVNLQATESLMIQCHKIKGSAASLGLQRAAKLAHSMEDLLHTLLHSGRELSPEMSESLLHCTETLRAHVEGLRCGTNETKGFNEAIHQLLGVQLPEDTEATNQSTDSQAERPADQTPRSLEPMTDAQRDEIKTLTPEGEPCWIVRVAFETGLAFVGLKASLVHAQLRGAGTLFYCDPPAETLESLSQIECITFGLAATNELPTLREQIQLEGIACQTWEEIRTDEVASPGSESPEDKSKMEKAKRTRDSQTRFEPKPAPSASPETNKKPTETLRVDIERLDHLMNLAGQLVINKARFSQIGEGLKCLTVSKQASQSLASLVGTVDRLSQELEHWTESQVASVNLDSFRSHARRMRLDLEQVERGMNQFSDARGMVNDLVETVHQLDRVADGIQKTIMDTRMVPIGPLFRRFKRVIRDITHSNGKDIQLVIRGENTELDKRMIDELGDPLIHMVRNCADHGIEPPDVREAAGKPRQGTVTLDAFHRGNSIVIEIRDNGKGLDGNKIRSKAIDKGLLTAADAEKLTPHQLYQLIWEPGLSTADKVTEVSGRGMGMDIVRTKIEEISGSIELDSTIGQGTTITIKLPLTLAILPSLLVEIEGDVIAVPLESVSEIVRVSREECSTVHGLVTATVRGRVISVMKLAELFSWNHPPKTERSFGSEEQSLVILSSDGGEFGLIVDRLLGEEDIVIKSMAENYRNVEGIAGASILGDGRVSLILDVSVLLEMSSRCDAPGNAVEELT